MTNLTELEKKYEELGKEIEALKTPKPYNGIWIPEMGEMYYTINGFRATSCWCDDILDRRRLKQGLVFRTETECDYHSEMEEKAFEIRNAGREEFKDDEDNWHVHTSTTNRVVALSRTRLRHGRRVYFDTEEQCRAAFEGLPYDDACYMISKGLI